MKRVVIASNNAAKLREPSALLLHHGIEAVAQSRLGVSEAVEPHDTFIENALAKARHASLATGEAALADDSGLCVPVIGGEPGVQSAIYAGRDGPREHRDAANNAKLVGRLREVADRSAYFYCVLVLMRSPADPCPVVADGVWHGVMVLGPRGSGGLRFGPHFMLPGPGVATRSMASSACKVSAGSRTASDRIRRTSCWVAITRSMSELGCKPGAGISD